MKKTLQIANIILFLTVILFNYAAGTGNINNTTIGEVSNNYDTLFTPASYAFSIWGLIYLLLFGFIIYQGRSLFKEVRDDAFILKTGWWFVTSCVANVLWIIFWLYGYIDMSVLAMIVLLLALLKIIMINRMELWDAPISVILFLWWPFVIYGGWITVATITNIAAFLKSTDWSGWGISEITWTIFLIIISGMLGLIVIWKRNMREFALVLAWALFAVCLKNWELESPIVSYVALGVAVVLCISAAYHGYKNQATAPYVKWKEYKNSHQRNSKI